MGCLNSGQGFNHWFGNIHLSGPCNRSCYFCIGQHMQELDSLNNLKKWPLAGLAEFVKQCHEHNVEEVYLTGTNTDPLLYWHIAELAAYLRAERFPIIGVRTNGDLVLEEFRLFDRASISITSFDPDIYRKTMGKGKPPALGEILERFPYVSIWVNIVLCPEILGHDLERTLDKLNELDVEKCNLREPYGQPHIGNPLAHLTPISETFGNPTYKRGNLEITYWDVHYTHVESVNLYANGRVSLDYPITRGHSDTGQVMDQSQWTKSGRQFSQWNKK